jgi:hypothetical protein
VKPVDIPRIGPHVPHGNLNMEIGQPIPDIKKQVGNKNKLATISQAPP